MEEKKSTFEKILETALSLFAEKGYKETTIDEIAKECNIAKGSVYVYFKSKEDIAINVLNKSIEESTKVIFSVDNIKDPYERIIKLIKNGYKYIIDNEKYWRSLNNLANQSELKKIIEYNYLAYHKVIIDKLSSYLKDLGLPNYKFEAKMLLAFFDGIQLHYYYNKDKKFFSESRKYLLKRYSKEFLDFLKKMK